MRILTLSLVFAAAVLSGVDLENTGPAIAEFHDNEVAAGTLADGVLTVRLRALETDWRPYGPQEAGRILYAFAEGDGGPVIPGPYLRAPLGTRVDVTIENTLDSVLVVHGFGERKTAPLERWFLEPVQ